MVYNIRIQCDNAAFGDDWAGAEVARILRDLANQCAVGMPVTVSLRDSNGNKCGNAVLMGAGKRAA